MIINIYRVPIDWEGRLSGDKCKFIHELNCTIEKKIHWGSTFNFVTHIVYVWRHFCLFSNVYFKSAITVGLHKKLNESKTKSHISRPGIRKLQIVICFFNYYD